MLSNMLSKFKYFLLHQFYCFITVIDLKEKIAPFFNHYIINKFKKKYDSFDFYSLIPYIFNWNKKMNDLPQEYDAIIIGTGLTETILSSALSRIGKTVLHIDK